MAITGIRRTLGIEAMIGAGYAYMKYDKLRCAECGEREGSYTRTYFGPTASVFHSSISYVNISGL